MMPGWWLRVILRSIGQKPEEVKNLTLRVTLSNSVPGIRTEERTGPGVERIGTNPPTCRNYMIYFERENKKGGEGRLKSKKASNLHNIEKFVHQCFGQAGSFDAARFFYL